MPKFAAARVPNIQLYHPQLSGLDSTRRAGGLYLPFILVQKSAKERGPRHVERVDDEAQITEYIVLSLN
jgi:hypothetical protein